MNENVTIIKPVIIKDLVIHPEDWTVREEDGYYEATISHPSIIENVRESSAFINEVMIKNDENNNISRSLDIINKILDDQYMDMNIREDHEVTCIWNDESAPKINIYFDLEQTPYR